MQGISLPVGPLIQPIIFLSPRMGSDGYPWISHPQILIFSRETVETGARLLKACFGGAVYLFLLVPSSRSTRGSIQAAAVPLRLGLLDTISQSATVAADFSRAAGADDHPWVADSPTIENEATL